MIRGSVFHPSDFSEASEVAFAHALKIALVTKSQLSVLHVAAKPEAGWADFPGVRQTLERWGLIPAGSPRSAVASLGLDVQKVMVTSSNPVKASLGFLERHPADLIVLSVHHHEGRMRWMGDRVGEPIARHAGEVTLFIPHGVGGFVSREDGSVTLRKVLVPVTGKPRAQPAVDAVARLIQGLGMATGTVTLLHVGAEGDAPAVKTPADTGWAWNRVTQEGQPAEIILDVAQRSAVDLIVMTTDGPDGFLDGLRGTTSERVLRQSRCPVAILPVGAVLPQKHQAAARRVSPRPR